MAFVFFFEYDDWWFIAFYGILVLKMRIGFGWVVVYRFSWHFCLDDDWFGGCIG